MKDYFSCCSRFGLVLLVLIVAVVFLAALMSPATNELICHGSVLSWVCR